MAVTICLDYQKGSGIFVGRQSAIYGSKVGTEASLASPPSQSGVYFGFVGEYRTLYEVLRTPCPQVQYCTTEVLRTEVT